MNIVYINLGTSNARIYLIRNYEVVYGDKMNIGSKDVSINGDNGILIRTLKKMYDKLLDENKITDSEIFSIYASGMITSPYGLVEISHQSTPLSLNKLAENIHTHYEDKLFERNIHLIRGVKTITENFDVDSYSISNVNNMRGEEIEILGIISKLPSEITGNSVIILPGSHTHIAYVKEGSLNDILSTFSGELYFALSESTILSGSLKTDNQALDNDMVSWGYESLEKYGISRALYMAHAMKIFEANSNLMRKSFLEGVITGGVVQALLENIDSKWIDVRNIVIAGNIRISSAYEIILQKTRKNLNISIAEPEPNIGFAAEGMIEILRMVNKN